MSKVHEFANKVVETLKASYEFDCVVTEVIKNGVTCVGIQPDVAVIPARNIIPCVYVDSLDQNDVDAGAEYVYSALKGARVDFGDTFFKQLEDKNFVLSHIFCAVERDSVTLKDKYFYRPVRDWDLNMYLRLSVDVGSGSASIRVPHSLIDTWRNIDLTAEEVVEYAVQNTINSFDCMTMDSAIVFPMPEEVGKGMIVASNKQKYLGAGVIICDEILSSLCDALETDEIVILPSSIHEVIVLPKDMVEDFDYINKMICEINATQLRPEEILSDHCYIWKK